MATGSYAPKGFAPEFEIPQGAEEADGVDSLIRVVRDQIGKGADWIKSLCGHSDGRCIRPPVVLREELARIVETAGSVGDPVAAHATSKEGMRRAALAGVATIEHGDGGDCGSIQADGRARCRSLPDVCRLRGLARYAVIAREQTLSQPGSNGAGDVQMALDAGVTIANGSDMGVFAHGEGARELELLVDYGMKPRRGTSSATSSAAKTLRLDDRLGTIKPGLLADLICCRG